MSPVIDALHTDHANFSKLLSVLKEMLDAMDRGDRPDYNVMLDVLDYLASYADLYHHPKEDVIYEFHLHNSSAAGEAIAVLIQQHKALKTLTARLQMTIEGLLHDAMIAKQPFVEQLADFIERQDEHLNIEEAEIFPLLEHTLTPDDWQRIEAIMPTRADPLFGSRVARQYETLYERIAETC